MQRAWEPIHKPWFNNKCSESFSNLVESATSQGLDLVSKARDFKKFQVKNKDVCDAHFQLMNETRKLFNEKQDMKEARKMDAVKAKEEKVDAAAISDGFVGVKKKTFDTDAGDDNQVNVNVEEEEEEYGPPKKSMKRHW